VVDGVVGAARARRHERRARRQVVGHEHIERHAQTAGRPGDVPGHRGVQRRRRPRLRQRPVGHVLGQQPVRHVQPVQVEPDPVGLVVARRRCARVPLVAAHERDPAVGRQPIEPPEHQQVLFAVCLPRLLDQHLDPRLVDRAVVERDRADRAARRVDDPVVLGDGQVLTGEVQVAAGVPSVADSARRQERAPGCVLEGLDRLALQEQVVQRVVQEGPQLRQHPRGDGAGVVVHDVDLGVDGQAGGVEQRPVARDRGVPNDLRRGQHVRVGRVVVQDRRGPRLPQGIGDGGGVEVVEREVLVPIDRDRDRGSRRHHPLDGGGERLGRHVHRRAGVRQDPCIDPRDQRRIDLRCVDDPGPSPVVPRLGRRAIPQRRRCREVHGVGRLARSDRPGHVGVEQQQVVHQPIDREHAVVLPVLVRREDQGAGREVVGLGRRGCDRQRDQQSEKHGSPVVPPRTG